MMVTDHWNFLERQKKESFFFDHSIQFSRFLWSKQGNHLIFIDNICPSPYMCSFRGRGLYPIEGSGVVTPAPLGQAPFENRRGIFQKNGDEVWGGYRVHVKLPSWTLHYLIIFMVWKFYKNLVVLKKKIIPPLPFLKESHEHVCPSHLILNEKWNCRHRCFKLIAFIS